MPSSCCIPGCKSNYRKGEKIKVFSFPKEGDRHAEWMRRIPRKDWFPGKRSVVCILHFKDEHVLKEQSATRPDGSVIKEPRTAFKLTPDAVPTIFPNLPKYISDKKNVSQRKNPDVRQENVLNREEAKIEEFLSNDNISSFEDLNNAALKHTWRCVSSDSSKIFYKLCDSAIMPITISSSFVIFPDMTIDVYLNQQKMKKEKLLWLLSLNKSKSLVINRWSQLENLMVFLNNNEEKCKISLDTVLENMTSFISDSETDGSLEPVILYNLKLLREQISLSAQLPNAHRYSSDLLAWAFSIYIKSPICYKEMHDNGFLYLPHVRTLKRLSSLISMPSSIEGTESYMFLKAKAEKLETPELTVNLMLDEIIVQPKITYSSDSLTGFSVNKELQRATSIQSFMISSLYSSNKDMVALFPVKNLKASDLLEMTKKILSVVLKAGYTVISIISDNNRINRNMFTELCGGIMKTNITLPESPGDPIFLIFDSVHIIKSIRNNWINQNTERCTFHFPNPDDNIQVLGASFDDLRDLHFTEKNKVIKSAPKLSEKALFPSNLERQNVNLCLKVFDDTNAYALEIAKPKEYEGTILFLKLINKWWKIVNIKNSRKGFEHRDVDSFPFCSNTDERLQFLLKLKQWLQLWRSMKIPGLKRNQGKLSQETFFAFIHTLEALHDIVLYLIDVKKDKYVLTGKFQTDNLEGRFGQYRQLNGGSYNLSVEQVLNSEKKLRLLSVIKLKSASYGEIPITDFFSDFTSEMESDDETDTDLLSSLQIKNFYFNYPEEEKEKDLPFSVFISGFGVHQLNKKIQCLSCKNLLCTDKRLILDELSPYVAKYFSLIDRGALTYPTHYILEVFVICLNVFQAMLWRDNEHIFLKKNVKGLLMNLVKERVTKLNNENVCTECGMKELDLAIKCTSVFLNVLLNNYVKNKNDTSNSSHKRKYDMFLSSDI